MRKKPRKRGTAVWVWRRRVVDAMGIERNLSVIVGTVREPPTEKHAWAASERQRQCAIEKEQALTLRNIVERYKAESLDIRHSTLASYLSRLNRYIVPLWSDLAISEIKPLDVERKINTLQMSKKTNAYQGTNARLFEFAMKCELVEFQWSPMLSV